MMHIYTVTQSAFQLWQIYPMICTQKIIHIFCESWSSDVAHGH